MWTLRERVFPTWTTLFPDMSDLGRKSIWLQPFASWY